MKPGSIGNNVSWLGAIDWDRRLFDSLIPLPDGTSYNAYLVTGSEKTALLDTVDPPFTDTLMAQLKDVAFLDYVISHHTEQDHSGAIPAVLEKFNKARVVATPKGKSMLIDHLGIEADRIIAVEDGQEISLGDKTLRFIYTPWTHWPETMCTYLPEDKMLFSCDLFGSHIASTDLRATDTCRVYEAAKRYFAEIMMPFRISIRKHLLKIAELDIRMIAPGHGVIHAQPSFIIDAYREWLSDQPRNLVVVPYVSMHGSTRRMVRHLVAALSERGAGVQLFDLSATDTGKLAMSLVDAATLVIGTPTVLTGPHPTVAYACILANALRPQVRFTSVIGSYGWNSRAVEKIGALISDLKVELVEPVLCKGYPGPDTMMSIERLADSIVMKHRNAGLLS